MPWEGLIPRNLKSNGGVCDAAVMPTGYWDKMRAGAYAGMDCTDADADATAARACQRDGDGRPVPTRDCGHILVGEFVTQVSVSMPVRSELVHALGWSTLDLISQGLYKSLRDGKYNKDLPRSVCPRPEPKSLSLPPRFLKGCVGVSGALLGVGLVLHLLLPNPARLRPGGGAGGGAGGSGGAAGAGGADVDVAAMLDQIGKAHQALLMAQPAKHQAEMVVAQY